MNGFLKRGWMALALGAGLGSTGIGEPLRVVTTIFPLTDWARNIGGDAVEVRQLIPPGVEAHDFAPRPSDLLAVSHSDIFIYLGPDLEPWAERLIAGGAKPGLRVIVAGRPVERFHESEPEAHAHAHEAAGEAEADAHHTDPHIWLDPILARQIVLYMAAEMGEAAPAYRDAFQARADAYAARLTDLHDRIESGLRSCPSRTILYGGHFAFGYFARRYGLEHVSPYTGFSPNAMPTPGQMAELMRRIRESGQKTIFYEEMMSPRLAQVLAEETGANLLLLHGAHNLTRDEFRRGGVTYLTLMEGNLKRLREGLGAAP